MEIPGDAAVVRTCVDAHMQYRMRGCDELTNAGHSVWHVYRRVNTTSQCDKLICKEPGKLSGHWPLIIQPKRISRAERGG